MWIRFISFLLIVIPAFSQTYYVSPSGSDTTGDGSTGNRFATPWFAAFTARTSGVKSIKLASGNYYNTLVSLTNASDSGLTIEADTGATPILYGGQPVTGWITNGSFQEATLPAFPSYSNNIVEFNYDAGSAPTSVYITNRVVTDWLIRDVLVDNIRIAQARLPAYTNWFFYIPSNTSFSIMKYTGTDIPDATVISNAELQVRYTWQASKVGSTNIDTTAKTIMVSPPVARAFGSIGWSNYALFNTAEGMTNGVWYHDRVNNKLIIRTNSLVGKTVIAPTRSSLFYIIGVTNVTIRGLTIRSTTHPFMIDTISGRDLAGAIDGWDNYGTTIENCTIENVCANGVRLGCAGFASHVAQLQNCNLSSNILNNCGASGLIFINGTAHNNNITNVGGIFLAAAGIKQDGNAAYMISNIVDFSTWSGLSSSLGMSNVIVFNTVINPFQLMDDAVAINTAQCSNVFIGFNKCYIVNDDNRHPRSMGGLTFDGGADYGLMVSNLIVGYHYPLTFNGTKGSVASNNICVATSNITAQIASFAPDGLMTHNIFDYTTSYTSLDTSGTNSFANNYFYSPLGPSGVPPGGIFTGRMIDSQYRLVHSSQLISPRVNPLVGLVPDNSSSAGLVKVGSVRQP